jgi:hypothetical protein
MGIAPAIVLVLPPSFYRLRVRVQDHIVPASHLLFFQLESDIVAAEAGLLGDLPDLPLMTLVPVLL